MLSKFGCAKPSNLYPITSGKWRLITYIAGKWPRCQYFLRLPFLARLRLLVLIGHLGRLSRIPIKQKGEAPVLTVLPTPVGSVWNILKQQAGINESFEIVKMLVKSSSKQPFPTSAVINGDVRSHGSEQQTSPETNSNQNAHISKFPGIWCDHQNLLNKFDGVQYAWKSSLLLVNGGLLIAKKNNFEVECSLLRVPFKSCYSLGDKSHLSYLC